MLPTFIIGLREGLEASLIVGIIAAFLIQRGERRSLRPMWYGVALAVALCLAVAADPRGGRPLAPPQAAGRARDGPGAARGRGRHVHGRVDEAPLARAEGVARGERRGGPDPGVVVGARGHGVLRGPARRARDRGLPAGGLRQLQGPGRHRDGGRARDRRGGRPGVRDLQGRRPDQPGPLLPVHGLRAGARGRRAPRERGPHGARGRLDRRPAGTGVRPAVAGRAGVRPRGAPDGDARAPARPHGRRDARVAPVRGPDGSVRPVARPSPRADRAAGAGPVTVAS